MLYVRVDAAKCCGYRLCSEACPELYKIDDQGFAYVDREDVPPELEAGALQGAEMCPESAIDVGPEPPAQR
jgi:ferredoxin